MAYTKEQEAEAKALIEKYSIEPGKIFASCCATSPALHDAIRLAVLVREQAAALKEFTARFHALGVEHGEKVAELEKELAAANHQALLKHMAYIEWKDKAESQVASLTARLENLTQAAKNNCENCADGHPLINQHGQNWIHRSKNGDDPSEVYCDNSHELNAALAADDSKNGEK